MPIHRLRLFSTALLAAVLFACAITAAAAQQGQPAQTASNAAQAAPPAGDPSPADKLAQVAAQFDRRAEVVVAEVNGTPITMGMVADRIRALPPMMGLTPVSRIYQTAVHDLVQQRVLAEKARQLGLDKDPAVQRRVVMATDHELANAALQHAVPALVTDKAIQDLYNAQFAGKPGAEEVRLSVIVTRRQDDAQQAMMRLAGGAGFATAALEYSIDPSKASGGDAGYATADQLPPELRAIAYALAPGQTTAYPVPANGLWFIIRVDGRRVRAAPPLAEVAPKLRQEASWEASLGYMREAWNAADIREYGPAGPAASPPVSASRQ